MTSTSNVIDDFSDLKNSPHNTKMEMYLLGAMIGDAPNETLHDMIALGLKPQHFASPDHAEIFKLLQKLQADGLPTDLLTLVDAGTKMRPVLAYASGGAAYVCELPNYCVSKTNTEHYAQAVIDNWRRRQILDVTRDTYESAIAGVTDPIKLATQLANDLTTGALDPSAGRASGWRTMPEVLDLTMDATDEAQADPVRAGGISTGFRDLDEALGKLHPSDLIVLAARPAMGKTSLALNIAENVATDPRHNQHVGLFSLEMDSIGLGRRTLAGAAGVSGLGMRTGRLSLREYDAVRTAHGELARDLTRLHVDDTPNLTISEIKARARQLRQRHGKLGLVVIDYLQLIMGELGERASREREVAHMSRQAKVMAKELQTSVLLLAQLNRKCEERTDKRPMLSDLRESGAIEQDADACLFVFRGEYYWPDKRELAGKAEVIIGKSRHSATTTIDLNFNGPATRFSDFTLRQLQHGGSP